MNDNFLNDMLQTYFPPFLKQFLNEFAETKFYKKTLEKRKFDDESIENFYYFDWEAPRLSSFKRWTDKEKINSLLEYGIFGAIPHYQHDELKTIIIDFKNKEAYLERGLASKVINKILLKKYSKKCKNYFR